MENKSKTLGKYSFGVGDRFSHQAQAQLSAFQKAKEQGVQITPVWNKSYREHNIISSNPRETRRQADLAIEKLRWDTPYFVDADHVTFDSVDFFLDSSDFFTLDVADYIGKSTVDENIRSFVEKHKRYVGELEIPGISEKFIFDIKRLEQIAQSYLKAVEEAGRTYRKIQAGKGSDQFVVEVSMDETDKPQTPLEIFFILSGLAGENIPVDTLAPKFSGRFNKGVDYVGDLDLFRKEFEQDLAVIQYAIKEFSLPEGLKLSVHSGSDKFSLYPIIKEVIQSNNAGLHIKTAGTTWLEELIGLALAGGEGLEIAQKIYHNSVQRFDELCGPYASVIDIDKLNLPSAGTVNSWDGEFFARALRHDQSCRDYNPDLRQLLHVGYKVAAEMKDQYYPALDKYADTIAEQVSENIYDRHMKPLFL
jgi:hypothetical protein